MNYYDYLNYYKTNSDIIISPKIEQKINSFSAPTIDEATKRLLNLKSLAKIAELVDLKLEKNNTFTPFEKEAMIEVMFSQYEYLNKNYDVSLDDYIDKINTNIKELKKTIGKSDYPYDGAYSKTTNKGGNINLTINKNEKEQDFQEYFIKMFSHELIHCYTDSLENYGVTKRDLKVNKIPGSRWVRAYTPSYNNLIQTNEAITELTNLEILKENFSNATMTKNKVETMDFFEEIIVREELAKNKSFEFTRTGNSYVQMMPFAKILNEFYKKEFFDANLKDTSLVKTFEGNKEIIEGFKNFSKHSAKIFKGKGREKHIDKLKDDVINLISNHPKAKNMSSEELAEAINKHSIKIIDTKTKETIRDINQEIIDGVQKNIELQTTQEKNDEKYKNKLLAFFDKNTSKDIDNDVELSTSLEK